VSRRGGDHAGRADDGARHRTHPRGQNYQAEHLVDPSERRVELDQRFQGIAKSDAQSRGESGVGGGVRQQGGPLAPDARPFHRAKRAARANAPGWGVDARVLAQPPTRRRAGPCHGTKSWRRSYWHRLPGSCRARPVLLQLFQAISGGGTIKSENCNRATLERGNGILARAPADAEHPCRPAAPTARRTAAVWRPAAR
jgi:hypothetical protein